MSVVQVAASPFVREGEGAIVELRREAVDAVARQQRLREELAPVQAAANAIEEQARRALARREDLLARQILAQGLCTLETRERLEKELEETRRRVAGLLTSLVRTEDRAWGIRRRDPGR